MANGNDEKYTDIEIIVFEGDDGDIEMEIIDEFELDGQRYLALRPPLDENGQVDDEDSINFFSVASDENGEELYDLVEDDTLLSRLADVLEERLLAE